MSRSTDLGGMLGLCLHEVLADWVVLKQQTLLPHSSGGWKNRKATRVKFWLRDISQISFGCVLIWARERKGREYGKSANSRSEIIVSKGTESI